MTTLREKDPSRRRRDEGFIKSGDVDEGKNHSCGNSSTKSGSELIGFDDIDLLRGDDEDEEMERFRSEVAGRHQQQQQQEAMPPSSSLSTSSPQRTKTTTTTGTIRTASQQQQKQRYDSSVVAIAATQELQPQQQRSHFRNSDAHPRWISERKRERLIEWLDMLGKWTFVDIFVLI